MDQNENVLEYLAALNQDIVHAEERERSLLADMWARVWAIRGQADELRRKRDEVLAMLSRAESLRPPQAMLFVNPAANAKGTDDGQNEHAEDANV